MKLDNKKIILSAFFMALAIILPFLTGQIKNLGSMLLPMHIPVILCGLICGSIYGGIIGLICPMLRSMIFGMPILFPSAVCMSIELMIYGFLTGFLYDKFKYKCIRSLYRSIIISMIVGRIIWGICSYISYKIVGQTFTIDFYMMTAFIHALPGIIIQLIIIPIIMISIKKTKMIKL